MSNARAPGRAQIVAAAKWNDALTQVLAVRLLHGDARTCADDHYRAAAYDHMKLTCGTGQHEAPAARFSCTDWWHAADCPRS